MVSGWKRAFRRAGGGRSRTSISRAVAGAEPVVGERDTADGARFLSRDAVTARFVGAWDARLGTAGGPALGAALAALAAARGLASHGLADTAGLEPAACDELLAGTGRATVAELARIALALKLRALAFLQQSEILGLEVYASGLDPLFFLPPGTTRHDARIYMREINPRHAVPERDMFARSPALAAIAADPLLDSVARLELELAYLLRTAAFALGGSA